MDQGTELENEDKQSCHSCMGHSSLRCSIILLSTMQIFPMVAELHSRNKNEVKYGLGDIIRKRRLAELSFLHVTLCTDMFSRSNKYSATALQQPPMGQQKSGCCREVTAMERSNI